VTSPQRLAIHRQDRLFHTGFRDCLGAQRLHPASKAGLEGGRLQDHQDTPENVLARNPIGQVEHLREEFLFEGRPAGNRGRAPRTSEHGQHSDDNHAGQGMALIDGRARILQLFKVSDNFVQRDTLKIRHG
jgi:hypothetical protein